MTTDYKSKSAPLDDVNHQISTLETRFNAFHTYRDERGLWNRLVMRDLPEAIPADLAAKQEGIDFQSPDPAKAIQDHVAVLKLNPPHFDVQVPGTTKASRDLERDQLLAKSTWFNRDINPRRRWESRVYEGLVRHGIKVEWLRAKKTTPTYESSDREQQDGCPNYFQNTLLDGNYWLGEDDPDTHYYKYSVPVIEEDIRDNSGKRVTLNDLGNIGWLGPDERHDYTIVGNKQVDIIVQDARDILGAICPLKGCDHTLRRITIYVCPKGKDFKTNGQEVESYPSPFPGSSFFLIGGHMFQTERDPDRVYRPLMEPMYMLQAWLNMLITWHAVLALQESSSSGMYADGSAATPAATALLNREGDSTTVRVPDSGVDEIPVMPFPLNRLPKKTSTEIMALIKLCLDMMMEYKPNRFQMGLNYSEASNATASANLAALQQSGIPYSPLLDEVAGAINKWDSYTDHQIRWYSYLEPDDANTRYYATVSGDESARTYGGSTQRGEQVYLDAKKCQTPHDLIVSIENLTWAEKQAKWYLEFSQYQAGVKTVEDLIRAAGIFDVEAQKRLLFRGQVRQSLQPLYIRMMDLLMTREASANTGTDFGALLQQVVPQQGMQEPPGTNSGNPQNTTAANVAKSTVQLPAMSQPGGGAGGPPSG